MRCFPAICFGAALFAPPVLADTNTLTCVVNAGRDVKVRELALNCGAGEEQIAEILVILERLVGDADAQKAQMLRMEQMLINLTKDDRYARLRSAGITEAAIIELARRISGDVNDPGTAFYELQKSVEIAIQVQDEAKNNPSTDAFVAEVQRRVAVLAAKGDYDAATQEADRALALWEAEQKEQRQRGVALLETALKQDVLRRDAVAAAARHKRVVELRENHPATVSDLRTVSGDNYRYALRFGGQFELELAIELSRLARQLSSDEIDSAMLWNDEGIFWVTLGERGLRKNALAKAVTAYNNALRIRTEKAHPVNWAITQNNLATALSHQGSRSGGEAGIALLAKAITAYNNALHVYTEKAHPVDWAMTQNNLAITLQEQGKRSGGETGIALLADAVTAYDNALRVYTEKAHPVDWAMTQYNLATAEKAIAGHEATGEPEPHLRRALEYVEAALRVYDPEHMPYDYGTASNLRDRLLRRLAGE